MNLLPLPSFLSCQACGALLPQVKGPRRRVSTLRYVCDCQCRRDYFEQLAGSPLYADVLLANAGHIGTVRISSDDSGAGGAHGDPDYREHLDMIVDAINPRNMSEGPFA